MVFIYSIDTSGEQHRLGIGGGSLEASLETVADLVCTGGVLLRVEVLDGGSSPLLLPVEAFDGSFILEPVAALQQQWQQQLFYNQKSSLDKTKLS